MFSIFFLLVYMYYEFQEGNHVWQFIIAHVLLFYAVRLNVGLVCWRVKVAQTKKTEFKNKMYQTLVNTIKHYTCIY